MCSHRFRVSNALVAGTFGETEQGFEFHFTRVGGVHYIFTTSLIYHESAIYKLLIDLKLISGKFIA